jgi:hypothetical protein
MPLRSRTVALIIGAYAACVMLLSLAWPDALNSPKGPAPNLRQLHPEYYAVISPDDTQRDRCIVDQGRRLQGFRDDYVRSAVMACDAATNVAKRNYDDALQRYEAAKLRPR